MKRIMEIYFIENKSENVQTITKDILDNFNTDAKLVEEQLLHTGYFVIDDESETFHSFLEDMGSKDSYANDKFILSLPELTGNNENVFNLFKKYLNHVGHDFEIREGMRRNPRNLYFAIFDEII